VPIRQAGWAWLVCHQAESRGRVGPERMYTVACIDVKVFGCVCVSVCVVLGRRKEKTGADWRDGRSNQRIGFCYGHTPGLCLAVAAAAGQSVSKQVWQAGA
jgi:hypothetical protein